MSEPDIRKAVKDRYQKIALSSDSCCCGSADCCESSPVSEAQGMPVEASSVNAGCGSPLALISPKEGDVVLDLGSGGGIDNFRPSQLGPGGKAIGVDATPKMVWRARSTKAKYGAKYSNTEFRLGEIEHVPMRAQAQGRT